MQNLEKKLSVMRCIYLTLFIIIIAQLGHSQALVSKNQLQTFIAQEKHGLLKNSSANGVDISIQYHPSDLFVLQDLQRITNGHPKPSLDSLRQLYKGHIYFLLKLSRNHQQLENSYLQDKTEYDKVIKYLTTEIASRFSIQGDGNSQVPISGHAFIPSFGMTDYTRIVLVVDNSVLQSAQHVTLHFDDNIIGVGQWQESFSTQDIRNTPLLDLNSVK
jgi:hypothetical protein